MRRGDGRKREEVEEEERRVGRDGGGGGGGWGGGGEMWLMGAKSGPIKDIIDPDVHLEVRGLGTFLLLPTPPGGQGAG